MEDLIIFIIIMNIVSELNHCYVVSKPRLTVLTYITVIFSLQRDMSQLADKPNC